MSRGYWRELGAWPIKIKQLWSGTPTNPNTAVLWMPMHKAKQDEHKVIQSGVLTMAYGKKKKKEKYRTRTYNIPTKRKRAEIAAILQLTLGLASSSRRTPSLWAVSRSTVALESVAQALPFQARAISTQDRTSVQRRFEPKRHVTA